MGATFASVDDYIAAFPKDSQKTLQAVRVVIKKAAPGAVESISYGIPTYKVAGKPVMYFGGFAKHYSIFGGGDSLRQEFAKQIEGRLGGKGTIQFLWDEPVPVKLIADMTKFRVRENAKG
jgi:uncharacterized protein YdhG (YjbR/CyaY superfamily)